MTKFILKVICVVESMLLVGVVGLFFGMLVNAQLIPKGYRFSRYDRERDKKHERPYRYSDYDSYGHYRKSKYEDEES